MTWRPTAVNGNDVTFEFWEAQGTLVYGDPPRLLNSENNTAPTGVNPSGPNSLVMSYNTPQFLSSVYTLEAYDPGIRNSRGGFIAPGRWQLQDTPPTPEPIALTIQSVSGFSTVFDVNTLASEPYLKSVAQWGVLPVFTGGAIITETSLQAQTTLVVITDIAMVPGDSVEFLVGCEMMTNNTFGLITPVILNY